MPWMFIGAFIGLIVLIAVVGKFCESDFPFLLWSAMRDALSVTGEPQRHATPRAKSKRMGQ